MLTTSTYGGRILEENVLTTGLALGTTSSKYSKALKKKTSFPKSQGYNKKIVSMSTPMNGKHCQLESQSYLMTNDYRPTYTV